MTGALIYRNGGGRVELIVHPGGELGPYVAGRYSGVTFPCCWDLSCLRLAVATCPHPVLGDVPVCAGHRP